MACGATDVIVAHPVSPTSVIETTINLVVVFMSSLFVGSVRLDDIVNTRLFAMRGLYKC